MSSELYKRYRPKTLDTVVGQDSAISTIKKAIERGKIPHSILLTGPSGVGKTTIARILKTHLKCGKQDFFEINCADFKGIDMIRDIRKYMNLSPISGETRIWLIDEAHKLTNDAQNAFLKYLEDTPKHVYFMLATTDPQKLIKTILTRCTEIKLQGVAAKSLESLLQRVIQAEGYKIGERVVEEIVDAADSSPRKALVILEQVGHLEGEKAQLAAIQATSLNKGAAIDLARLLVTKWNATWDECAVVLRLLKDEEPEGVRYCVLGYARACLVGGEGKSVNMKLAERAFRVIDIFSEDFYDSKQAGLAAACWEVVMFK